MAFATTLQRLNPLAPARARFQRWWQSRLPLADTLRLTQRNVYILPTAPGWMLAATLLVLLVASINYQLNLGYLLTFLLAGCAAVGMHVAHATLRGIDLKLVAPDAQFAGTSTVLTVQLSSERRTPRRGIGLALLGTDHWTWTDVPALGSATVHVAFAPATRGLHRVPAITAETRFPLGTFRVWCYWRPAAQVMVYPKPEAHPPPLPPGEPKSGGAGTGHAQSSGEFDGVRGYRRGDPLKLVVWKKFAKAGELVSRDSPQTQQHVLWLDFAQAGSASVEQRLSRLCAWVLQADQLGLDFGLRLPGAEIAPGGGAAHQRRCLEALALC
ncbi:hypothetical protein RD110_16525 [Rhodoferax koreense]|uniref:Uncharacterized protein n=1 Tax=Rhodoferax koreensis TaxID=1842727 RepID=A0A1P8JXW3_9BURK|nr:DUF58 domain-containing protein [Rhodoferax koreense]APW38604.1 hypothetical protein RD110_16525 [Rhodoferax koreense]